MPAPASRALRVLAWALVIVPIAYVAIAQKKNQWDFKVYYAAARALHEGLNPYALADRQALVPDVPTLELVYAPLNLYLFSPLAIFPLPVAYELWLLLKLVALGALVLVWSRNFLPLRADPLTLLFFVFAFTSPIYADLASGNPALFAELALWWGFAELRRGRIGRFCVAVALAAHLKISPIFFAVLPLLLASRRRWLAFAGSVAGFSGLMLLDRFVYPRYFEQYLALAGLVDERGRNNPSSLALIKDLVDELGWPWRPIAPWVAWVVFALFAAAVVGWSLACVRRYRRSVPVADERLLTLFACTVFALLAPRLKTYGCIILLIPCLHLLRTSPRRRLVPLMVALAVFPMESSQADWPLAWQAGRYLHEYFVWLAAFALWWFYCAELRRPREAEAQAPLPAGALV